MIEDTYMGWTKKQYVIAHHNLCPDDPVSYVVLLEDAENRLSYLKKEWMRTYPWAPLEGPMAVYDPAVSNSSLVLIDQIWRTIRAGYAKSYGLTVRGEELNCE